MTNQEAFDTVAQHLLKQGHPAIGVDGCAYRAPNGDKCAIGCLIPDDAYDPIIENCSVATLIGSAWRNDRLGDMCPFNLAASKATAPLKNVDIDLLEQLQGVHDCAPKGVSVLEFTDYIKDRLRVVAERFGLSTGVLRETV